jgi:hypothetical protein
MRQPATLQPAHVPSATPQSCLAWITQAALGFAIGLWLSWLLS